MSLINKMLQDLEARRAVDAFGDGNLQAMSRYRFSVPACHIALVALIMIGMVLVAAVYFVTTAKDPVPAAPSSLIAPPPALASVPAMPATPPASWPDRRRRKHLSRSRHLTQRRKYPPRRRMLCSRQRPQLPTLWQVLTACGSKPPVAGADAASVIREVPEIDVAAALPSGRNAATCWRRTSGQTVGQVPGEASNRKDRDRDNTAVACRDAAVCRALVTFGRSPS